MANTHFAFRLKDLERLDNESRLPLYAQLAEIMAKRIRASQAKLAGKALPSEMGMAEFFKISRPTVRQAMGQLLSEGLIIRGRGKGTFVAPPHASRDLGRAFEFEVLPANPSTEFQLVSRERVVPHIGITDLFKLEKGDRVERMVRLRLASGEVFGFEERFMPIHYAAKVTDTMLKREAGIVFARRLIDGNNGRVVFRVRAISADARMARLLKMKKGMPLLSSEHTYYSSDGIAVLHGIIFFRGDRYDFSFQAPVHGVRGNN